MIKTTADTKKLADMIADIRIAMLTTVDASGELHSRPMATQRVEFDGQLWFFTRANGGKIDEIGQNGHVNVAYARPDSHRYVSVSGIAQVVHDDAKMQEIWDPAFVEFFPGGLSDPDLALLKVTVTHAEYWTSPGPPSVVPPSLNKSVGFNRGVMVSRASGHDSNDHGHMEFPAH